MGDLSQFAGPIAVTCAYLFFWYYLLLVRQRGTKARLAREYEARGQIFDRYFGQDEEMLAVDRVVTNTQEQMVPFLVSLWLFSVTVSTFYATVLGGLYIALRAIYPVLLGKRVSKMNTKRVSLVTMPCYLIVFTFLTASLLSVFHVI
ncbi:MAG: MAPEG family protein [Spirochaetales bacterium]|nr:MAPEG family protein [Leptospiraceae bacterium]MCP5482399.1 MAPEG family protein [Spirochaetales bacterium]MCP5484162.1 MAPEG family protein [Spirochaetales bacterium]